MILIMKRGLRTWVEIDTQALLQNFDNIKNLLNPKVKMMTVIKSNAYGHDIEIIANTLIKNRDIDFFAVDEIEEALLLRKNGIKNPILVLGFIPSEQLIDAINNDISITLSSLETLRELKKLNTNAAKVHVLPETGLGRQGFILNQMRIVIEEIVNSNLIVEGIYSHFSAIENPKEIEFGRKQIEKFNQWVSEFEKKGYSPIKHATASAGIFYGDEFHFDMVRTGIALYGLWGSEEIKNMSTVKLSPVLSWKSIIAEIKNLPKGHTIGYDRSYTLKKDTKIAVVPVGYWHGYDRRMSNNGFVFVNNKKCLVLGRVSMDMIVIDVQNIENVLLEHEVELIGPNVSADIYAKKCNTISYEILTRINAEIKRIII